MNKLQNKAFVNIPFKRAHPALFLISFEN